MTWFHSLIGVRHVICTHIITSLTDPVLPAVDQSTPSFRQYCTRRRLLQLPILARVPWTASHSHLHSHSHSHSHFHLLLSSLVCCSGFLDLPQNYTCEGTVHRFDSCVVYIVFIVFVSSCAITRFRFRIISILDTLLPLFISICST